MRVTRKNIWKMCQYNQYVQYMIKIIIMDKYVYYWLHEMEMYSLWNNLIIKSITLIIAITPILILIIITIIGYMIEWEDKAQSYKKCHHLIKNNCNKIIISISI